MSSGRSKLGRLVVGSALVIGTAVLVAKNERLRSGVARAADSVDRFLKEAAERLAARRRRRPPEGTPAA